MDKINSPTKYYSQYAVYDIRSAFKTEPPDLINCPFCKALLARSKLAPSIEVKTDTKWNSAIPVYESTHLFSCPICQWWCVRERWSLYECVFASYDYLVTGILRYWDIANILEPLANAELDVWQSYKRCSLLAENIETQEQALTKILAKYWPEQTFYSLGYGFDEKRAYRLFFSHHTATPLMVLLSQTLSGCLNLDVVEAINAYFPAIHPNQRIEITSARLIKRQHTKHKLKRQTCNIELTNQSLESIIESGSNDNASWEKLSQLSGLYDSPRNLPESLKNMFLIADGK